MCQRALQNKHQTISDSCLLGLGIRKSNVRGNFTLGFYPSTNKFYKVLLLWSQKTVTKADQKVYENIMLQQYLIFVKIYIERRTSLFYQWLRIHLTMQVMWADPWSGELYPTCCGVTESTCYNESCHTMQQKFHVL